MHSVVTIKLISGEEIVGYLVCENDKAVTLSKALQVFPHMDQAGRPHIGFGGFMYTVSPEIELDINQRAIAVMHETHEAVRAKFIEATTGIVIPKNEATPQFKLIQ